MPNANCSAMPVFWMAVPKTTEPAKTIRMSQLMDFMAWSTLQQRNSSIAIAARKAHCSSGMTLSADNAIIDNMMVVDMRVFLPIFGTCPESKNCSCEDNCSVLISSCGEHSKSKVSPACSTTSRGDSSMRLPLRATATSVMLLSFSKVELPMDVLIRLLPKVT